MREIQNKGKYSATWKSSGCVRARVSSPRQEAERRISCRFVSRFLTGRSRRAFSHNLYDERDGRPRWTGKRDADMSHATRADDVNSAMDPPAADSVDDESDDLFSDDEQKKEIGRRSNVSHDSILSRSETPLLFDSPKTTVSTDAVIPSTPLSLLPFLSKINEQWSSDLETPQAQAQTKPMTVSAGRTEVTPRLEQRTPDVSNVKSVDKIVADSPVISSRATRRRSKRRIFRSSASIDPSAVTDNEDITAVVQVETPVISDGADSPALNDTANAAVSKPSFENDVKDCEPEVLDKSQDKGGNEKPENFTNAVPDSLNTSTQEFFSNASFSKIDELCSDTFNKPETMETVATRCNYESNVEIKGRSVDEEKSIGFFTARGASINVSKQALLKAKRLFADAFDMDETQAQDYESFAKRNCNEEKNRHLPSTSFANNVPANIAKEFALSKTKLLAERSKNYDEAYTADCKKPLVNKSSGEEVNKAPVLLSTASGNPINISKEALLRAKASLANETDNIDDDALIKYYERSSVDKNNSVTLKNKALSLFSTTGGRSINIAGKSPAKATSLFAKQSDITVKLPSNKTDISDNEQCDKSTSNIKFRTACGAFEQVNSKARASAEQLDGSTEPIALQKTHIDDNEIKGQEAGVLKIGFQTGRGKPIGISEQALSRAKALFADLDDTLEVVVAEKTNVHCEEAKGLEVKNIRFQSGSVNISEQTSKAKVSFERLDGQLEFAVANKADKISDKVETGREVKIPSIGFQTACGTAIKISEQALSRAKALFADELDPLEMDILKNNGRDDEKIEKRDSTVPHGGLQAASGQRAPVSNNAALTARELFSSDRPDESNPDLERASLQKRKLSVANVDESTPQGRIRASETKKARLSGEFHARKLFFDNPGVDNVENRDPDVKSPSVVDSVLVSPKADTVESTESDVAGSPVIGRQSIPRKRKSVGYHRDEYNASRADKKASDNESASSLRENVVVQGSAARGKIEDDKLDTETTRAAARERARGDSAESSEYGDTQVMLDFIDQSARILQDRLAAALEQEAIITAKRRRARSAGSKRSAGHLYRYRQINSNARLSLREIGGGAPPVPRPHQELVDRRISPDILDITAATAATYRFRCSDFYGNDVAHGNVRGIEMEDGARLIMDESGCAGVWELLRAFLASPSVEPSLVPARWVENHYRWIVWKLASMDRMKFGSAEIPRALTPSHVMAQLKYRYDREIDQSQRPAIRRILEKDDVASKRMILCVSSIIENNDVSMEIGKSPRVGVPKWRIELTDGWYSTNACIDLGMMRNVATGKIREGTKLMVSGAELLNCDQGFYPLEAPADVCLKLHTNSTRRARWDTKLGYAPRSGPIPIRLRNVCPSGGLIGKMTIVVARVYPMLYHEKTASGDSIVRNARSEEKERSRYEQRCWSKIEAFYANAEDFQGKGLSCETDDMAIQLSEDYESLSTEKRHDELLQELRQKEERFNQRMQSKLRESLPGPRQVSQLLKVRVCDENANAVLSVWSPGEDVVDALKEGACVSLCNIVASGKRGTELQLTARRSAIFKPGKTRDTSYPARACTSLCEIANSEFAPPYGEFDTVGLVCSVGPAPYGMKDFEVIHLAYREANLSDFSYLSILFWQGIASYGYAEILTVGSIVACSNLEWRRATSWNVPAAYCTDRSTFTRNPRRNHLYESFENLKKLITDPIKDVESCTLQLNVELQKKSTPTRYTTGKNTPIKIYSSTSSADKKLVDYTSPLATPKLGVGNSSTYVASNPSIQKRLEKLQHYGEASELSPLVLKNSKRISLDFQSPIRISEILSTKLGDLNQSNTTEKH
ncbi:PREDICTED: breast cancer type 2 susceptibility protein-like isoform X2 [Wasmannia auropunctata]|uniref:breast cancer type 2 susceptibility protein-like isoform X2 n=1 Tax=Wasmannia auropunctata TaxID=64793 RepID=UPI0005EE18D6|nr:PREDICTED: breast cancer type 2 susceptibility protein-like isoform X2 [Wasmannia auropunctata]